MDLIGLLVVSESWDDITIVATQKVPVLAGLKGERMVQTKCQRQAPCLFVGRVALTWWGEGD